MQMFSNIVMDIEHHHCEEVLEKVKHEKNCLFYNDIFFGLLPG